MGIRSSALHGQGQLNGLGFSTTAKLVATSPIWGSVSFLSLIRCHFYGTVVDGKGGRTTSPMILVMLSYIFAFRPGQGQCLLLNM